MKLNYFVSVFFSGKYRYSYYSENLDELVTIKAMHKGCDIEIFDLQDFKQLSSTQVSRELKLSISRWKKSELSLPIQADDDGEDEVRTIKARKTSKSWVRPVMCVETGQVFASAKECSDKLCIPYTTIIYSIKCEREIRGLHFVYALNL